MIDELLKKIEHIPPLLIKKSLNGILWEGTPESEVFALTFDDGPHPDVTPGILDVLDEYGMTGNFFMLGSMAEKYPDTAALAAQKGHLVGNHSMTHKKLFLTDRKEIEREIAAAQKAIKQASGILPKWFRPPHGLFDLNCVQAVKNSKLRMVLWTVLSGDYSDDPFDTVYNRVEPFIRPGAIMVFHDSLRERSFSLEKILRKICETAIKKGLKCGSIEELSTANVIKMKRNGHG